MWKKAVVLVVGALMLGCAGEAESENPEIVSNLIQAGFPQNDILVADGNVYVGRDAHVTLAASREMLQARDGTEEQYRTTNLVSCSTVTKICLDPSSTFNSYATLSQALDGAIANYNSQAICFRLARGPGQTGCSATINVLTTSGAGGSAGFPSGGLPYPTIYIGTGTTNYGVNTCKHVITHEIGHTIGFRHSDYYNRSISCGSGGNEGDAGVGAIFIPGTPSTATVGGSVMNSCFRASESGNWTGTDITALLWLAPAPLSGYITRHGTWNPPQYVVAHVSGGAAPFAYAWYRKPVCSGGGGPIEPFLPVDSTEKEDTGGIVQPNDVPCDGWYGPFYTTPPNTWTPYQGPNQNIRVDVTDSRGSGVTLYSWAN